MHKVAEKTCSRMDDRSTARHRADLLCRRVSRVVDLVIPCMDS